MLQQVSEGKDEPTKAVQAYMDQLGRFAAARQSFRMKVIG